MDRLPTLLAISLVPWFLASCASHMPAPKTTPPQPRVAETQETAPPDYAARLPQRLSSSGEQTILVDPNVHAWGAYDANGSLIRAGLATAGAKWCPDIGRPCKTSAGSFRIQSLGSPSCVSSRYPRPYGGAPMPYCMFFNKNQGLHGSYQVVEGNASHGCVRMQVHDAEWVRYHFANIGTRVIVRAY